MSADSRKCFPHRDGYEAGQGQRNQIRGHAGLMELDGSDGNPPGRVCVEAPTERKDALNAVAVRYKKPATSFPARARLLR
jgi:hypothetical protein